MHDLPGPLEQKLRDALERHGLSDRYQQIRPHARITFLMEVSHEDAAAAPLGKSRLGGTPDLPKGVEWAGSSEEDELLLDFIAQINLSELPAMDQPLTASGILYICAQQEGACDNEHSLQIHPAQNLVRAVVPEEDNFADEDSDEPFVGLVVSEFVPSVSLPDAFGTFTDFDDPMYDAYAELLIDLHGLPTQKEPVSHLLGHPSEYVLKDDQALLIQVESHFHDRLCYMNFWDAGCLQIVVNSAELPTCQFSDSEANIFSN